MVVCGDIFTTNNCGNCIVTHYESARRVTVRFIDTGYSVITQSSHLRSGKVKDLLCRTVYGVGFIGDGKHSKIPNKQAYKSWNRMLKRCYSPSHHNKHPSYKSCTVCDEWHNFQSFAAWYESNYPKSGGADLDKDIKVIGNKTYSPETCLFVPSSVNKFILDRGAKRGEFMIGVCWSKSAGRFTSSCRNPMSGRMEHLGCFDCEIKAHLAWRERKSMLCEMLARKQERPEVTLALLNWKFALDNGMIYKYKIG